MPRVLKEDWMQKKWRPMMGWTYMMICIFDFVLAPILFTAVQFAMKGDAQALLAQWQPLTLQTGGFFHIAMGAVLGISAYGRTKEKMTDNNKKEEE